MSTSASCFRSTALLQFFPPITLWTLESSFPDSLPSQVVTASEEALWTQESLNPLDKIWMQFRQAAEGRAFVILANDLCQTDFPLLCHSIPCMKKQVGQVEEDMLWNQHRMFRCLLDSMWHLLVQFSASKSLHQFFFSSKTFQNSISSLQISEHNLNSTYKNTAYNINQSAFNYSEVKICSVLLRWQPNPRQAESLWIAFGSLNTWEHLDYFWIGNLLKMERAS